MGCLRTGALLILCPFVGGTLGYLVGGSLIPVPDWALDRIVPLVTSDPRVDTVRELARTAGHIWGALQGSFYGLLIGIVLAVFLAYRARTIVR
ncbi:hypothetical protein EON81_28760 [bacterium]|nr:MAG: hypothetical protein EON81_28760 [bacterium]